MIEKTKAAAVTDNKTDQNFAQLITPIITSVFAIYLTIGMTLGVLPDFIKNDLKFNSLIVGLVIGSQSLATLLTRAYSGKITDTKGAKLCSSKGIKLVVFSGLLYSLSAVFSSNFYLALGLVFLSRMVHGIAESMLVTAALTWGIGLVGAEKSGKVMTWNGIAMYAGIAIGAPAAIWMKSSFGIVYVFISVILMAILSWLSTLKLPALPVDAAHIRKPFYKVIGLISGQGLGLAFSSIGFACISSFVSLLYTEKSWGNPSMAFMTFGLFYVLTRVLFSSFTDKYGGYRVALVSLSVEIAGQLLIGFSVSQNMALAGCALTGIGFSLIFPALGTLAIKKVTPQNRGTALGAYAAFFDLSLGLAGPVAGLIAGWYNYQAIYLFGATSCLLAMVILFSNTNKKKKELVVRG
ncbi:MFS transporter [Pedobacter nutrimenti]|jgi:MFS family permease|uniref:Putative MFS family arabinose efflux permease n=1 Tax=Pedobacter nutrimenti TaxID=1241337 RepID=A0A318UZM2_9SPHI|nr:MFS transporter [Pedobacter nutrimenti]PYF77039.1 putative MFS family arabinose efflux permease [Pedobacter nutrimenti]